MITSPRLYLLLTGLALSLPTCGWGQLRVVTYNTATSGQNNAPATPRAGMDTVLQAIGDDIRQGISKPIDVLLLQEIQSSAVTSQAFVNLLNDIYGPNVYARATINPSTTGGGRVGLVYNSQTVQLVGQTSLSNASPRDTGRYQLRPIGYGADADFFIYNDHYKAGTSSSDQTTRANHAATVRNNATSLGQGAHIIYAGDFNIRSSSETMYQNLLAAGASQAFDPISRPGNWHNSSSLRITHTQSPYDPLFADPTLIAGGVDDRFDFQLVSGEMFDGEGLAYISGTYHAFGNNGSHRVNDTVNDPSNTAQPTNVLNALASVSDHLPVVADFQVPAVMQIAGSASAGRAIQGSFAVAEIDVWNDANVVAANGADELDYTIVGLGGLSGSFNDTDEALGVVNTHAFVLDTSTFGMRSGSVQATASSAQVANPSLGLNVDFEVVDHANASLDAMMDIDSDFIDLGIVAPGSQSQLFLAIHNLASPTPMAALDLFDISQQVGFDKFTTDLMPFTNLESGQAVPFTITLDTSESGLFATSFSLLLGDEDIPGGLVDQSLSLGVTGSVALPGDANLDGTVDGADFVIWNANKFLSGIGWESGDFNGDGVTDGLDFIIWNDNKFAALDGFIVPEPDPASLALALLACWLGGVRGRHKRFVA